MYIITTVRKKEIEMVWVHNKVNRTCKDVPTGHGTRREKKGGGGRQKKRWEDNVSEWTGLKYGEENREGWSKVIARFILDAPTVIET